MLICFKKNKVPICSTYCGINKCILFLEKYVNSVKFILIETTNFLFLWKLSKCILENSKRYQLKKFEILIFFPIERDAARFKIKIKITLFSNCQDENQSSEDAR